jgi:hypothetical protein
MRTLGKFLLILLGVLALMAAFGGGITMAFLGFVSEYADNYTYKVGFKHPGDACGNNKVAFDVVGGAPLTCGFGLHRKLPGFTEAEDDELVKMAKQLGTDGIDAASAAVVHGLEDGCRRTDPGGRADVLPVHPTETHSPGLVVPSRDADVEDAGAGSALGEAVGLVVEVAALEAEAAAADAAVQVVAEPLELGDPFVEPAAPALRQPAPVRPGRGAVVGERVERLANLGECQADPLGRLDECDPPQRAALVLPLVACRPPGVDQALVLVEPQRRCRYPGPMSNLPDGQPMVLARDVLLRHTATLEPHSKNSSSLEVRSCYGAPAWTAERRERSDWRDEGRTGIKAP